MNFFRNIKSPEDIYSIYGNIKDLGGSLEKTDNGFYYENGELEKLWTDNTLDEGYLSYTVTESEYVKSGYTVKAFLFDSLTSAIPQVGNAKLTIQ